MTRPIPVDVFRAIFEASPDGVLVVDSRGVIREINAACESMFGYKPGELVGQEVEVLVPLAVRDRHVDHMDHYAAHPRRRPMGVGQALVGLRRDGVEFPVEISLSPLMLETEAAVIATVRDDTQRKRLRDFSAGALLASEEERRRIALELHDDTAQRLSSLLVRLRILDNASNGAPGWRDRFDEFRDELIEAAEGVRRMARGLHPPELRDAGVEVALRVHARSLQEGTGVEIDLDLESVDALLGPDAKLVLYRVVQEALTNVVRHSGASRARLAVRRAGSRIVAQVDDDGKGFALEVAGRDGGLGLFGMRERATLVGGQVWIESQPGGGTRVRLELPTQVEDVDVESAAGGVKGV